MVAVVSSDCLYYFCGFVMIGILLSQVLSVQFSQLHSVKYALVHLCPLTIRSCDKWYLIILDMSQFLVLEWWWPLQKGGVNIRWYKFHYTI